MTTDRIIKKARKAVDRIDATLARMGDTNAYMRLYLRKQRERKAKS